MGNENHVNRVRNGMQIDGQDTVIDSVDIEIILQDDEQNILFARGTTVPSADAGFSKGCIFIKTNAGDGVKSLYENQGTTLLCSFNLIGDITEAEIANLAVTTAKLANLAVTGEKIAEGTIGASKLATGLEVIKFADRLVSNAELKALHATPIELVPATEAGAGFAIVPLAVMVSLNAGTEVLTESADNLVVKCDTTELIEIETTGFIDQATDQNRYQEKAEAVITPIANTALMLANKGDGEIGGNETADATLSVRTYYRIVPVL